MVTAEEAIKLCDRNFGIGGDGVSNGGSIGVPAGVLALASAAFRIFGHLNWYRMLRGSSAPVSPSPGALCQVAPASPAGHGTRRQWAMPPQPRAVATMLHTQSSFMDA